MSMWSVTEKCVRSSSAAACSFIGASASQAQCRGVGRNGRRTDQSYINDINVCLRACPARSPSKFAIPAHLSLSQPIFSKTGKESIDGVAEAIPANYCTASLKTSVRILSARQLSTWLSSCRFGHLLWHKMCWIRWIFLLWWRVCDV